MAGYITAAMPLLVGLAWELIFEYRQAKHLAHGWAGNPAPPYAVQFLVPIGLFGLIAFALVHLAFALWNKIPKLTNYPRVKR